jgi:hypothetical protein
MAIHKLSISILETGFLQMLLVKDQADIKLIQVDPKSNNLCHYEKRRNQEVTEASQTYRVSKRICENRVRDQSDAAISSGTSRIASEPPVAGKKQRRMLP